MKEKEKGELKMGKISEIDIDAPIPSDMGTFSYI